jgi:hypothetical protein
MKTTHYLKWKTDPSRGEVFTPKELVKKIIDKIPEEVWINPESTFIDPCMGKGTFLIEIYKRLVNIYGYSPENAKSRIYGYDVRVKYVNHLQRRGFINVRHKDFLKEIFKMKFDVVLGNPPYHKQVGPKKTEAIWPKFVEKSFEICKEGGYVSLIHPSGWRDVDGNFKDTQKLLLSKKILHLVMCNTKKGLETFGVNTNFDWYFIKNKNEVCVSTIIDYNNNIYTLDISENEFIPNSNIELVYSLVAKEGEERVEILHSYSDYETRKPHMSKVRTDKHIYPCAYTIGSLNPNFWYSNINRGHIGLPKVIWGNGLTDVIVDIQGQYGLTQFCYAIVDEPKNLELIKNVLKSEFFIKNIMGYTKGVGHIYNRKIIGTFKKDFWKYFLDEDNNVIEPNFENVERI